MHSSERGARLAGSGMTGVDGSIPGSLLARTMVTQESMRIDCGIHRHDVAQSGQVRSVVTAARVTPRLSNPADLCAVGSTIALRAPPKIALVYGPSILVLCRERSRPYAALSFFNRVDRSAGKQKNTRVRASWTAVLVRRDMPFRPRSDDTAKASTVFSVARIATTVTRYVRSVRELSSSPS